jgi:hypothetical protein
MIDNKNCFCKAHSGIEQKLENLESDTKEQWQAINQLRNRLPVWATIVISLLTFFLGATATYAGIAVKIIENGK